MIRMGKSIRHIWVKERAIDLVYRTFSFLYVYFIIVVMHFGLLFICNMMFSDSPIEDVSVDVLRSK